MGAPRVYRTEAIVLRRANSGEADKVLTLFTPARGKLPVVAKAIRRPLAKLSGHLDLFCRSELLIAKGKNLDVVAGAQMIDGYATIRDDLVLTSCAIYALEFADRFGEQELENRALYELLVETLEALATGRNPEMVLRYYELRALDHVGFRPQLRTCLSCDRPIEPVPNYFGPDGVTCPDCPRTGGNSLISVDALKVLRFLQANTLPTALRLRPEPRVLREVDTHLRRTIRSILERELKSTQFLDLVRHAS